MVIYPLADEFAHIPGSAYIQAQGGFVQEKHLRVGQETAHNVHLLSESSGEIGGFGVDAVTHANDLHQFLDALVSQLGRQPIELGEHPQVLADGKQTIPRCFTT